MGPGSLFFVVVRADSRTSSISSKSTYFLGIASKNFRFFYDNNRFLFTVVEGKASKF